MTIRDVLQHNALTAERPTYLYLLYHLKTTLVSQSRVRYSTNFINVECILSFVACRCFFLLHEAMQFCFLSPRQAKETIYRRQKQNVLCFINGFLCNSVNSYFIARRQRVLLNTVPNKHWNATEIVRYHFYFDNKQYSLTFSNINVILSSLNLSHNYVQNMKIWIFSLVWLAVSIQFVKKTHVSGLVFMKTSAYFVIPWIHYLPCYVFCIWHVCKNVNIAQMTQFNMCTWHNDQYLQIFSPVEIMLEK